MSNVCPQMKFSFFPFFFKKAIVPAHPLSMGALA